MHKIIVYSYMPQLRVVIWLIDISTHNHWYIGTMPALAVVIQLIHVSTHNHWYIGTMPALEVVIRLIHVSTHKHCSGADVNHANDTHIYTPVPV